MPTLYLVAIVLCILRWVPKASPLYAWLPGWLQWAPAALTAAAGVIASRLHLGSDALAAVISPAQLATVDACLEAGVGFFLAAQAGLHPPAPSGGVGAKGNIAILLFLGFAALGCSSAPEPCSQAAIDAQTTACAEAIYAAPEASKADVYEGCRAALDLWRNRCGKGVAP